MSNKTVVITGASSGIGFALAQAYLRRGDNVVGNARSQEGLAAAAGRLGNPASFLPVAGDIALASTAREIVRRLPPEMVKPVEGFEDDEADRDDFDDRYDRDRDEEDRSGRYEGDERGNGDEPDAAATDRATSAG